MRFRNGTQEDPNNKMQLHAWRSTEIQKWNSRRSQIHHTNNMAIDRDSAMELRISQTTTQHWTPTFHANETKSSQTQRCKTLAGLYNILSRAEKRKKNVGRAIHIAGHNFAHTHPA